VSAAAAACIVLIGAGVAMYLVADRQASIIPTTTTTTAYYWVSESNVNTCASGYTYIRDETSCQMAATTLQMQYQGIANWGPTGCYCHDHEQNQSGFRYVWYYGHSGDPDSSDKVICKAAERSRVQIV